MESISIILQAPMRIAIVVRSSCYFLISYVVLEFAHILAGVSFGELDGLGWNEMEWKGIIIIVIESKGFVEWGLAI